MASQNPNLVQPTVAAFRAAYPEFGEAEYPDDHVASAASFAVELTALSDRAALAVTAHLLACREQRKGRADGGASEITSTSTGPISSQFTSLVKDSEKGDAWYAITPYGREFIALKRSLPKRLFSVRFF